MDDANNRRRTASGSRPASASSRPGPTAPPPQTPRQEDGPSSSAIASGARRRTSTARHLSAKQYERMVKNLESVQRSARKTSGHADAPSTSYGPAPGTRPGQSSTLALDDHEATIQEELDESGERVVVPLMTGDPEADEAAMRAVLAQQYGLDGFRIVEDATSANRKSEHWLRLQKSTHSTLAQGIGKGPDGVALAKAAAKGLKGKGSAPPDSFLHEASFVFNPLTSRVPQATPRKARKHEQASRAPEPARREARGGTALPAKVKSALPPEASHPSVGADGIIPLASADKDVQEALILDDLLFVLMGIEGQYITYSPQYDPEDPARRLLGADFVVDSALDPSLSSLVQRILPLAKQFTSVQAFVETESSLEYGTEYEVLVVQLEHQLNTSATLTLQKFWFYIHPTIRTMSLVHTLVMDIASITHARWLEGAEDDSDNGSTGDEDEESVGSDASDNSLEREKRALFGLDEEDDSVPGGIVKGGETLAMIWDRVEKMSGDPKARSLFITLFNRAAQPYARILLRWISTGKLTDPYDEFMIMEDPRITVASLESDPTDEYWERRYSLRDETVQADYEQRKQQGLVGPLDDVEEMGTRGLLTGGAKVPVFLQPWKRKILLAGKYLNVVRECGKELDLEEWQDELDDDAAGEPAAKIIDINQPSFFLRIDEAYHRANTALFRLLLKDYSIVERLRSMKHYFLLSSSDFFSSFLETAGRELRKTVDPNRVRDVTVMRLQSHLGMVLGSSSSVGFSDPFREDVKVQLASENAYDQLMRIAETKGGIEHARAFAKEKAKHRETSLQPIMELLQFDLGVKFPVSLVISKKNILRWQFLQRPIFHLKAVERALGDAWLEHQDPLWRESVPGHPELEAWKRRVYRLRQRITFFVQQVLVYITSQVIEPNWRELEAKIARAKTVDQFMKDHFDFLNTCRKECMLTDQSYVLWLSRLMNVASAFCESRVRFRDQLAMERSSWLAQREADGGASAATTATGAAPAPRVSQAVLDFVTKLERNWDTRMRVFRDIVALASTTDNPASLPLSLALQSA